MLLLLSLIAAGSALPPGGATHAHRGSSAAQQLVLKAMEGSTNQEHASFVSASDTFGPKSYAVGGRGFNDTASFWERLPASVRTDNIIMANGYY